MDKKKKTITICASASFYKDVIAVEKELKKLGFKVKIPVTAKVMQKRNMFDVEKYKLWMKDPKQYHLKTKLMVGHFRKVIESDAILVLNLERNGRPGYIGGNMLMEMVIAFHHKKPIFIYDAIADNLSYKEEVYGLNPIFIQKKLDRIRIL